MVDTQPLREYLHQALQPDDGVLMGIDRNIAAGRLQGVALTANSYETGDTVVFFRGHEIEAWERPYRKSVETRLTIEHIMASSALPLLFPPVRVGDRWYGDGGVRLNTPLGPAVHMGADRLLVISTHFRGITATATALARTTVTGHRAGSDVQRSLSGSTRPGRPPNVANEPACCNTSATNNAMIYAKSDCLSSSRPRTSAPSRLS